MCVRACTHAHRVFWVWKIFLGLEDIGDQMSLNFSTYTLFSDDIIVYLKILENQGKSDSSIKEYRILARYNISVKKSILDMYTNN